MSQPATCIHCGAPLNRPGAKFCTRCGKPQDTPIPAARASTAGSSVAPGGAPEGTAALLAQEASAAPGVAPAMTMIGGGSPQGGSPVTGPVLIVQDVGRAFEVALGPHSLSIGRAPDNDIVITSRFVSGRHARIEPHGVAHQIIDIGSTNGLLFEGKRLPANTPHVLADSDVLRIGDPATGNFVTLTYRNPQAPKVQRAAEVARSYRLDPTDPQITIGREGCEILLDNPQVSRRHAVIDRVNGKHVLRDVGSTNGTFVNGR
ncbi:MAG: FHA domain-containing protein, partial [Roseiflexus sp.]|nr:FHA domain-containing protein [Roseiflexus sp.]